MNDLQAFGFMRLGYSLRNELVLVKGDTIKMLKIGSDLVSFLLFHTLSRIATLVREKELAAVKINAADVDIIANELELDKKVAERTLREHKGDAVAAIRHLLH
ncbi:hypothetical protein L195_g024267 [Trifolium pratense]|uniref:Nascent polypeptide-associated complex subunit alpha-like UBA domain-containing protein n=1 Tax=Trifolium pratense TaxID=57577 RepID=A0A2K3ND82_TRIPR|nr:hypothetical protein L195_g024267 [Trifolium pratense]